MPKVLGNKNHSAKKIPEGKWVIFNYDRKWEGESAGRQRTKLSM